MNEFMFATTTIHMKASEELTSQVNDIGVETVVVELHSPAAQVSIFFRNATEQDLYKLSNVFDDIGEKLYDIGRQREDAEEQDA